MKCIFCEIVKKKAEAKIVFEDKKTMAFLPRWPAARGHLVVIPKGHYESVFDIPESALVSLIKTIKKLCDKIKKATGADVNILNASGKMAQQSVFHLHFHIVPRKKGDKLDLWIERPEKS